MEIVRDISQELKSSYIDYAMSVIVGRALPDVRDGLKPVQRRILYTVYKMGLLHNKPYKKCARIVGSCLGNYHPHGDAPVYEALVRMAQDFVMRYPLIDGQGNFGSIDGDSPAAMRYTEAKLTKLAEEMIIDIDKDTVDFVPNFDSTLKEPTVLPSKIPNLLINGSTGIAVGMATSIPPHNLSEICDAIKAYIKNPKITIGEIMNIIKGPDFPTGGMVDKTNLIRVYESGRGKIVVKGAVELENNTIVIKEIPYMVNKAKLVERIAELIKNGRLEEAKTVRDESDREGLRVVVELKGDPNSALDKLYRLTNLQINLNVMFLALVDGKPRILNIKELIEEFVKHRRNVIRRKVIFELKKSKERLHIVEGLKVALQNIDEVITIIKKSKTPEIAKNKLMEKYKFSELQAEAILRTRLQKLTSMEIESLIKEHDELNKKINELSKILEDPKRVDDIIINETEEIKKNYGDNRKTKIVDFKEKERTIKFKRQKEVVLITDKGCIRKVNAGTFVKTKKKISIGKDLIVNAEKCFSDQKLVVFTNYGKAYGININKISSKNIGIDKLLSLKNGEKVTDVVSTYDFSEDVLILTKDGYIKKINLSEFRNAKKAGILASHGEILKVIPCKGDEIGIATRKGYFVRFRVSEIPRYGRQAKGVRAIKLRNGDEISWMTCMDGDGEIIIITENGFAKRTRKNEYRLTNRGSMGVICVRGRNAGNLVAAEFVKGSEKIIVLMENGEAKVLEIKDIVVADRNKVGKKIVNQKVCYVLTL